MRVLLKKYNVNAIWFYVMSLFGPGRFLFTVIVMSSLGCAAWQSDGFAETELSTGARADIGLEIAQMWCRQCHVVEPEGAGFVQSDVPTFDEIANFSDQSIQNVENFMQNPHPPMPRLNLSREVMRNLATYILSLKRENGN